MPAAGGRGVHPVFKASAPLLVSSVAMLALGGLGGLGFLLRLNGLPEGPLVILESLYPYHWAVMIYGFTLTLIGAEILGFLSSEWRGKPAPWHLRLAFLALQWTQVALLVIGELRFALALGSISLALLAGYSAWAFLKPSQWGFPPTHYNYLLALTPVVSLSFTLYWLLGLPGLDLRIASIVLPITAIIAVGSRDIPLLVGVSPRAVAVSHGGSLRRRAVAAFILGVLSSLALGFGVHVAAAPLLIATAMAGLASVGLMKAVAAGGRRAVPEHVKMHAWRHMMASYAWLAAAGLLAAAWGLGVNGVPLRDSVVHAVTLGFMFNVILGVDAILLPGHAGLPLNAVPRPSIIPGALLNASVAHRVAHPLM